MAQLATKSETDRGTVLTIGHSNRSLDEFVKLLSAAEVELVADIRTIPRSRNNPQFNKDALPEALGLHGVAYEHMAELGGRRGKSGEVEPQVNGFWTNTSFHNYADYALSEQFGKGLEQLISTGRQTRTVMMCSEAVWWRCHRRIVSDWLLARGEEVLHVMGVGRLTPATLNAGAVVRPDASVVYPASQ